MHAFKALKDIQTIVSKQYIHFSTLQFEGWHIWRFTWHHFQHDERFNELHLFSSPLSGWNLWQHGKNYNFTFPLIESITLKIMK